MRDSNVGKHCTVYVAGRRDWTTRQLLRWYCKLGPCTMKLTHGEDFVVMFYARTMDLAVPCCVRDASLEKGHQKKIGQAGPSMFKLRQPAPSGCAGGSEIRTRDGRAFQERAFLSVTPFHQPNFRFPLPPSQVPPPVLILPPPSPTTSHIMSAEQLAPQNSGISLYSSRGITHTQFTSASPAGSRSPSPTSGHDVLTLRALVNTKEAGVIIGKGGKNVADLREQTGVRAGVSKVIPGVHERVLTVGGSVEAVAKVRNTAVFASFHLSAIAHQLVYICRHTTS
jgi:hypothetical protein